MMLSSDKKDAFFKQGGGINTGIIFTALMQPSNHADDRGQLIEII